jgi:hypothetical protein
LTGSGLGERRSFLTLALASPLAFLGCGGSYDGHIQIGDATKSEVKARAELYRSKVVHKNKKKPARRR